MYFSFSTLLLIVVKSGVLGGLPNVLAGLSSTEVSVICYPAMTLSDFCRHFQLWLNGRNCVLATGGHVLILHAFDTVENGL